MRREIPGTAARAAEALVLDCLSLVKTCPGFFGVANSNSLPQVTPIPVTVREALQGGK